MLGRGDGLEWLKVLKQRAGLPEDPVSHRRRQRDHRGARDEGRRRRLPAQAGADAREADHLDPRPHRDHGRAHGVARPRGAHGGPLARRQGAHPGHQGAAPDRRGRHGARLPRLARERRRAAGGQDPAPGDRAQQEGAGALHGGVRHGRAHPEPPRGAHLRPRQLPEQRLPGDGVLRGRRPQQAPGRQAGAAAGGAEVLPRADVRARRHPREGHPAPRPQAAEPDVPPATAASPSSTSASPRTSPPPTAPARARSSARRAT